MSAKSDSPYRLPTSPRAVRNGLLPIDTSLPPNPGPYSDSSASSIHKMSAHSSVDDRQRRRGSLIFADATIPLSPPPSPRSVCKEAPFEGIAPRRRNPFVRLFCCLGREERARRRAAWSEEYEHVGEKRHWTEV